MSLSLTASDTEPLRELLNLYQRASQDEYEIRFKGFVSEWADYERISEALSRKDRNHRLERSLTATNKNESPYVSGVTRFEKVYDPSRKETSGYTFKKIKSHHDIDWLRVRIAVSTERPVTDVSPDLRFGVFRYRVRQSFTVGGWRYDLTRVVTLDLDSDTRTPKEFVEECHALPDDAPWGIDARYELEAERLEPFQTSGYIGEILEAIRAVYEVTGRDLNRTIIDNTVYPMIREHLPNVRNFRDLMNKPVPLTRERMTHLTQEAYAASLKIDGERAFVFVPHNLSEAYLLRAAGIDPVRYSLEMDTSGDKKKGSSQTLEPESGTYLIDGEIHAGKFWMFDCILFVRNVSDQGFENRYIMVRDKFTGYRLRAPGGSWDDHSGFTDLIHATKPWWFSKAPADIWDIVARITRGRKMTGEVDSSVGFGIDGVMFQPVNSPYYNKRTYKWKPPEMNSIDFLVRVIPQEPAKKKNEGVVSLRLYVGTSLAMYSKIMHQNTFDHVTFPRLPRGANYGPMPFIAPGGQHMDSTQFPVSMLDPDMLPIQDDSIYEFTYRPIQGNRYGWVPIRLREDRTAEYRKGTFFGNNYDVASEVWDTIRNPIPLESLTTPQQVGGGYWANPNRPSRTGIGRYVGMVKTEIYGAYIKRGARLLEIAGGRGGDLNRWERLRVSHVTNLDSDQDALREMENRLQERYRIHPELREQMTVNPVLANVLETDFQGEFDVVSCMFAIHYFLRNEADFMKFFSLVDRCLIPGGYLLITSLDGQKVLGALRALQKGNAQTLVLGEAEDPVATIRAPEPIGTAIRNYGQRVSVKVSSIGEEHDEYLVNYTYLQRFFRNKGYTILASKPFRDVRTDGNLRLAQGEEDFISLARYMVLQRGSCAPPAPLAASPLNGSESRQVRS